MRTISIGDNEPDPFYFESNMERLRHSFRQYQANLCKTHATENLKPPKAENGKCNRTSSSTFAAFIIFSDVHRLTSRRQPSPFSPAPARQSPDRTRRRKPDPAVGILPDGPEYNQGQSAPPDRNER